MFVHITEFDWKHKLWVWGRISQGLLMALVSGHLSVNVYSGLGEAFWTWESSFSPRRYVQFALTPFQRALLPAEDLLALSQRSQSRLPNISDFGVCVGSKSMHPCLLGALSSRPWPNWYRSAIFKDVKASEVILFSFFFWRSKGASSEDAYLSSKCNQPLPWWLHPHYFISSSNCPHCVYFSHSNKLAERQRKSA